MMKKMMKVLLGIVVIGGLMFVGCSSNNNTSNDKTNEDQIQFKETDSAVLKYGDDLTLNNGEIRISDYVSDEQLDKITIIDYEKANSLDSTHFETEEEIIEVIGTLVGGVENMEKPEIHDSKETVKKYITETPKEESKIEKQEDPYLDHDVIPNENDNSCPNCASKDYLAGHPCPDCYYIDKDKEVLHSPYHVPDEQIGDVPEKTDVCRNCDREFITNQDDYSGLCNDCKQHLSKPLFCSACGKYAVDPETGICKNCGTPLE